MLEHRTYIASFLTMISRLPVTDIKLGYIFGDIQILVIYVIQIQILICGYQGYWYIVIESEYILFLYIYTVVTVI